jgi:hypothetical protein
VTSVSRTVAAAGGLGRTALRLSGVRLTALRDRGARNRLTVAFAQCLDRRGGCPANDRINCGLSATGADEVVVHGTTINGGFTVAGGGRSRELRLHASQT